MKRFLLAFFAVLIGIFIGFHSHGDKQIAQRILSYSGATYDSHNAYSIHGFYKEAIEFSPDEQNLVYLWSDCKYMRSSNLKERPTTLNEKLEIRVRRTLEATDFSIPLDSVDFGKSGKVYYLLDASVRISPDSLHVAGLSSLRLLLLDLATKTNRSLEYPNEFFGSFSWRDSKTLCFSTYGPNSLTFWRWRIDELPNARRSVYKTENYAFADGGERPPRLQEDQWSPNGRFVSFRIVKAPNKLVNELLDMDMGVSKEVPFPMAEPSWKPDSGYVLVPDYQKDSQHFWLLNPITSETEDLFPYFQRGIGLKETMLLGRNLWTPDGKYLVIGSNLVQPKPFKVILSLDEPLRSSPIPGWLLVQGRTAFRWVNYSGSVSSPIKGWPNDWTWSPKGNYAAKIEKEKIVVFKPELPSLIKR